MASDLEVMTLDVEALYTHDENGRMLSINNKLDGRPAPRFFLGRTREGNIWRFRYDLPEDVVSRLSALCSSEPIPTDLQVPPVHLEAFREALEAHAEIQHVGQGPAYRFPEHFEPAKEVVRITRENADLLRPSFAGWIPALALKHSCLAAVVEGGRAVSVCGTARASSRAAEAGVETLQEYRGKGYAVRAVAGWALAVRELGLMPLYSTSCDNIASQRVAAKLGLILYGSDLSFT